MINDLTTSAEVYISPLDCAELEQCTKVFPVESVKGRETAVFARLCEL